LTQKKKFFLISNVLVLYSMNKHWNVECSSISEKETKNIQVKTQEVFMNGISIVIGSGEQEFVCPIKGKIMLLRIEDIGNMSITQNQDTFEGEKYSSIEAKKVWIETPLDYITNLLRSFSFKANDLTKIYKSDEICFLFGLSIKIIEKKANFTIEEIKQISELIGRWPIKGIYP